MIADKVSEKYKVQGYILQVLFGAGIIFGTNKKVAEYENWHIWVVDIAQYVIYFLIINASVTISTTLTHALYTKRLPDLSKLKATLQEYAFFCGCTISTLVYFKRPIFGEDFLGFFTAYLIFKLTEMGKRPSQISYGTGMACSFFEGYLTHVIPSDGAHNVGFLDNINRYEANENVVFPVRRLFIIIPKTLKCPPSLSEFNKENRDDLPKLTACKPLPDVEKAVAGVQRRVYRNSAYRVLRPGKRPVYVAAECATPLHTLYGVLQKRQTLYKELSDIDIPGVVDDFTTMLKSIISIECKDKCEIVHFDNEDPNMNLADVLLNKIRDIEPNFETITRHQ